MKIKKMQEIKQSLRKGEISIADAQKLLRMHLLLDCQSKAIEIFANRIDNQIELIIYTIPESEQLDQVLKAIDWAIDFQVNSENYF